MNGEVLKIYARRMSALERSATISTAGSVRVGL